MLWREAAAQAVADRVTHTLLAAGGGFTHTQLASKGFGDKKSARLDLIFTKCNQRIGMPDENENNPDK